MDKIWVTVVWLCGPVAGLVVQPTIGVLSDRYVVLACVVFLEVHCKKNHFFLTFYHTCI